MSLTAVVWGLAGCDPQQAKPKAMASTPGDPPESWQAPASWANKKNPVPADAASIASGKKLFEGNCVACHGPGGKGDGVAAPALTPKPSDLTAPAVQKQSDGALFWKITTGHSPMPAFQQMTDKQRWDIVNYIRALAPESS